MKIRSLSLDAQKTIRGKFKPSTTAEREFYKSLRKVAQASGHIVDTHIDGVTLRDQNEMMRRLTEYSKQLEPWARRQSKKLLDTVSNSNKRAYQNKSKAIGTALKLHIADENVQEVARALMEEQVALIQSIPTEAGRRAAKIVAEARRVSFEGALTGQRAQPNQDTIEELKKQLNLTTEVATSRAQLIAVTETARSNATINQARAISVGSGQYRWHNSGDGAVRPSHKSYKGQRMQGKIFNWDNPPTLDDGMTGHPGTFPRCRCFAEPVFDDE